VRQSSSTSTPASRLGISNVRDLLPTPGGRITFLALSLLAIAFAHLVFANSPRALPIFYDAMLYKTAAEDIATQGLFAPFRGVDFRTYAYPLFLSFLLKLAHFLQADERWVVFEAQLLLHLVAVLFMAITLVRAHDLRRDARAVSLALLLNPFVLIYPAYMLTESLTLSLSIVFLALIVRTLYLDRLFWSILAGSLCCGTLIMVRPANIFLLIPWSLTLLVASRRRISSRSGRAALLLLAGVGTVAPALPQVRNNLVHFGRATPLVVRDLGEFQQREGIRLIKYATAYIPGVSPEVPYVNPFADAQNLPDPLLKWYLVHPLTGPATAGLHMFNVLDQDLPLPYNTTLTPAYYPACTIANFAFIGLGIWGIGTAVVRRRRASWRQRWLFLVVLSLLLTHLALHSVVAAESRFGVLALVPLYVSAALTLAEFRRRPNWSLAAGLLAIATAMALSGTVLSRWVRQQAPAIRESKHLAGSTGTIPKGDSEGPPRGAPCALLRDEAHALTDSLERARVELRAAEHLCGRDPVPVCLPMAATAIHLCGELPGRHPPVPARTENRGELVLQGDLPRCLPTNRGEDGRGIPKRFQGSPRLFGQGEKETCHGKAIGTVRNPGVYEVTGFTLMEGDCVALLVIGDLDRVR
jgi:4-amino-4-deoxy-L-arabinose transferase-like glycosyltransferase